MWLLEARSRSLIYFADEREVYSKYAILSHTWHVGEVSFQDISKSSARVLPGYAKIDYACLQAERDGLKYVWIDTCCINKTSSAELSEAINSMFRWYFHAAVCYAFLADVPAAVSQKEYSRHKQFADHGEHGHQRERELRGSRWFKRCWTLQELVAPDKMIFYNRFWGFIGDKAHLWDELSEISGVEPGVFVDRETIWSLPVARRLSWSSRRSATRLEDEAYSLLGILNVSMPLLYGEGRQAFHRLQEEVIKNSTDHSIFAWDPWLSSHFGLLLSPSPFGFRHGRYIQNRQIVSEDDTYEMTNKGLRIGLPTWNSDEHGLIAAFNCRDDSKSAYKQYILRLRTLSSHIKDFRKGRHLVCEVDRMPETHLSRQVNYAPGHERVWQDLMIVREGTTTTIAIDASPGIRIFGAFPEENWHPRSLHFQLRSGDGQVSWGYIMISHFESQSPALLCFGQTRNPSQPRQAIRICWNVATPNCKKETVAQKVERALTSTRSKIARIPLGKSHYLYAAPVLWRQHKGHTPLELAVNPQTAGFLAHATWTISISVSHVKSTALTRPLPTHWPFQPRGFEIFLDLLTAIPKELWKPSMSMKSPFVTLHSDAALYCDFGAGHAATNDVLSTQANALRIAFPRS